MLDLVTTPFLEHDYMRRALAACVALAAGGTPLGVFMTLRRMSLVGDTMSHAIFPGVAVAFIFYGASLWPMTLGGFIAGVIIALLAVTLTRATQLREDSSFAMLYLLSVASGVILISLKGGNEELVHTLFGDILALSPASLALITGTSVLSLLVTAVFYREMVIDCFDPDFAHAAQRGRGWISQIFFVLLVINLIAAFQALGTLMALGLMLLPAIAARFWTRTIDWAVPLSIAFAAVAAPIGLLISYYAKIPPGPTVVLSAGAVSLLSVLLGRHGSLRAYISNGG